MFHHQVNIKSHLYPAFKLCALLVFSFFFGLYANGQEYSVRFFGSGVNAIDQDRIKIQIDDPLTNVPGPPADIGATDFTIEFWVKGSLTDNSSSAVSCGNNINWIYGNIVLDRDRYNQDRKFGISFAGGIPVFGISGNGTGDFTLCGNVNVLDGQWHHLAFQRQRTDGYLWIFVDGILVADADGPDGDISYPNNGVPGNFCGNSGTEPCLNSDPFLVLGAEKHDAGSQFPSFNGFLEELRLSTNLRYSSDFQPLLVPFTSDATTAALYHFDEGAGNMIFDASGAPGGPSNGLVRAGGNPAGPIWTTDSPFNFFLSVELSNFEAVPQGNTVELSWSTQTENGSLYFEIERSRDAESWELIKRVDAAGQSTSPLEYSWTDNLPYLGIISYYRLKLVDGEDRSAYSSVIAVELSPPADNILLYPNPADQQLAIFTSLDTEKAQIRLFNALGADVTPTIISSGAYFLLQTAVLQNGIYWLVIDRGDYREIALVSVMR